MYSFISSLTSHFRQMEVITETLVICACLVFGGVVIKRKLHRKPWETLPDDVMEIILPHLCVRDRIRLSIVCKPWSSVSMRSDIPSAPRLPWLILPQSSPNYLSYFELSEGKSGRLELPEPVPGGWFQGSSKGWMIMVMEKDLDSTMFLVNPISGAQQQLPPLSTAPCFQKEVETARWKRYGASAFCFSVVLSTSDITSHQFMVAATFGETDRLCLYKPGDRKWTILEVLDANECITDLLFSSGKLYALVISHNKNGVISSPRNLKFGDHAVELCLGY
ncbi:PREDICTED: F-box/kelch-repeat protein At1g57790-like [Fragaria vesca subsp. vesca]